MKKSMIVLYLLVVALIFPGTVLASSDSRSGVYVRIEGPNKSIAAGYVEAHTLLDAISEFTKENKINADINAYSTDGVYIKSIDGVNNGYFKGNDCWLVYIERDGDIVHGDNIYTSGLFEGDKVVVYYGDKTVTKILSSFTSEIDGDSIVFYTGAKDTNWSMVGGKWMLDRSVKPVSGVRINLKLPNSNYKILRTDSEGKAVTSMYQTGVYSYNAEGYVSGGVPSIVPTEKEYFIHGVVDGSSTTRGEAAAFLVNTFGIKQAEGDISFYDVSEDYRNYKEIMVAASQGIINGRGEGVFAPDEKVSLVEFCVMLSNVVDKEVETIVTYNGVPEWASKSVNMVINEGLLKNVDADWQDSVTSDILLQIYLNWNAE